MRGVAKSAVHKAVTEKRISLIDGKIDPAVADIQWEKNTRARGDSARATLSPGAAAPQLPLAPLAEGATRTVPTSPGEEGEYSVNRARRERYEADLAQIKLQEQQGDLVRVVEVRAEIAKRIGQVRMNLLQIPARLAPLLATETDQARIHLLLDGELRQVLTQATAA